MLPANIISAQQVHSHSGRPLIEAAPDTFNPIAGLKPGQQLQGTVQSRVSEGLFKVQVAGQTLQMRLPGNIQSGDTIKLEVIAMLPRLTFSMVASSNPLSTPEQIGATARILSNLAELPLERLTVKQLGNKAVWDAEQQALDTKLLASALREALGKSGLFYESHQAQWIRGERSMNQLLEEPQNVLTRQSLPLSFGEQQRTASAAQSPSDAPVTSDLARDTFSTGDTAQPIAKELLPLVQQQLHALEHHHLGWIGQVWAGQAMQWEIQGQPEHPTQHQDERQWSTEIELDLPRLGSVHARLVFAASGLQLSLNATDTATVDLFNRTLVQLRNSLAHADIALTTAVVEKS